MIVLETDFEYLVLYKAFMSLKYGGDEDLTFELVSSAKFNEILKKASVS